MPLPGKIVAVAKNYAKHQAEMGSAVGRLSRPAFFLKPASSVVYVGAPIVRPARVRELHHEVELGVVISRRCSNAAAEDWRSFVRGYVLALDMTARELQAAAKKDGMPWTVSKCFDSFTPLSSEITVDSISDPHAVELWLSVDGIERQRGRTADMLAKIPEILAEVSYCMTLDEGDIILTGTPEGVGAVEPGQVITAGITGIAEMRFPVLQGI